MNIKTWQERRDDFLDGLSISDLMQSEINELRIALRGCITREKANRDMQMLRSTYKRMQKALNDIASWSEGETVNSSFDEPHSAEIARKALENTK